MTSRIQVAPRRLRSFRAVGVILVFTGAVGYVVLQMAIGARVAGRDTAFRSELVEQIVFLAFWAMAAPGILWSAARFPLSSGRWPPRLALHLAVATGFIVVSNLLGPIVTRLLLGRPIELAAALTESVAMLVGFFHVALIVYAFILGLGHYLEAREERRRAELKAERLRADLAEARLRALRLQLEPHFLFNTLNAVGSLILTGRNAEAFEAVGQLGDLLRAVLATEQRHEVTLRDELDLTRAYLAIEQTRLGDRLRSRWEIGTGVEGAHIPPMVLQPLVENAIRHGIAKRPEGGELLIGARRAGERLQVLIEDDGPGPDPAARSGAVAGLGIENTRRRLEHLYGAGQRFELVRDGGWTRALIEIPFRPFPAPAARLPA